MPRTFVAITLLTAPTPVQLRLTYTVMRALDTLSKSSSVVFNVAVLRIRSRTASYVFPYRDGLPRVAVKADK